MSDNTFAGWAILELFGHRRLAGHLSEAEIAGGKFLRLDIPGDKPATQFYGTSAVYSITPTTEEIARGFAANNSPQPVQRWELPDAVRATVPTDNDDEDQDEDDHPF